MARAQPGVEAIREGCFVGCDPLHTRHWPDVIRLALEGEVLSLGAPMRRREFITLLGSAAAMWPLAARAQQPAKPLIGWLDIQTLENRRINFEAFRKGLGETGFVDGQNATIDFRSAEYRPERLPDLASNFVRRPVDLIMASANQPVLAAKAATKTIPIVFAGGFDPVGNRRRRQPRAAGRQCHRREFFRQCLGGEAAGAFARGGSAGEGDRRAGQP